MRGRECLVQGIAGSCWPSQILRRDLGRCVQSGSGIRMQQLAQEMLAMALAIGPRGIEEGHAFVHSLLKRSHRFVIIGAGPVSHPPHPVADLAHFPARTPEHPILHEFLHETSYRCSTRDDAAIVNAAISADPTILLKPDRPPLRGRLKPRIKGVWFWKEGIGVSGFLALVLAVLSCALTAYGAHRTSLAHFHVLGAI